MSTKITSECQQADALLNESLAESPADDDRAPVSQDQRLLRAAEYQADALSKKSNRDASLGALNAGLVRIANHMEDAIVEALEAEPVTLERIRQIEPALNDQLRLTRQIERFAQLVVRLEDKQKVAENAQAKLGKLALHGALAGGR